MLVSPSSINILMSFSILSYLPPWSSTVVPRVHVNAMIDSMTPGMIGREYFTFLAVIFSFLAVLFSVFSCNIFRF